MICAVYSVICALCSVHKLCALFVCSVTEKENGHILTFLVSKLSALRSERSPLVNNGQLVAIGQRNDEFRFVGTAEGPNDAAIGVRALYQFALVARREHIEKEE